MSSTGTEQESEQLRKIFIGGLSYDTTDDGLRGFYEQFGEIVDCVVMKEPKTRISRGFGFVTYSKLFMVDEAMANRPHTIDGRKVEPKRAIPREISNKTSANIRKLFIGKLGKLVDKEDLEEYFGKYGKLTDCAVVISKETGEKRGFGFVEYDDVDAADKVVLIENHVVKGQQVDVKKALPREESGGRGGGGRDRGNDRGGFRDRGDRRGGGRDNRRGPNFDGPRPARGNDNYKDNWANNQGEWNNGGAGDLNRSWGNNQGNSQGWGGHNSGGNGGNNQWGNSWGGNQGGSGFRDNSFQSIPSNMGGSGGFNKGSTDGGYANNLNGLLYETPSNFNSNSGFNPGFGNQSGGMGGGNGPIRNNYNSNNRSAPYPSGSYGGRN